MKILYSDHPFQTTAEKLSQQIIAQLLANKKVVLFLSGGSAVKVLPFLKTALQNSLLKPSHYSSLIVTLVDERFGELEHQDSNGKAVEDSEFGEFMKEENIRWIPVLQFDMTQTESAAYMNLLCKNWFNSDDFFTIGLFGAGEDFHTASNMPSERKGQSFSHEYSTHQYYPAITLDENYDNPFRKRLGLSEKAIRQIDSRILVLSGESKRPVLEILKNGNESIKKAPVLALNDEKTIVITDLEI